MIHRGPDQGKNFLFETFPVKIGRGKENSLTLTDTEVSRCHLVIIKRGQLYILKDLESKNGCFLNGERVINSVIQNGDSLSIGNTEFSVMIPIPEIYFSSDSSVENSEDIIQFPPKSSEKEDFETPVSKLDEDGEFKVEKLSELSNHSLIRSITNVNIGLAKKILNLHSNILVLNNLEDIFLSLMKGVVQICPKVSRISAFKWSPSIHRLIPITNKKFTDNSIPFQINKNCLSECLATKQGVYIVQVTKLDKKYPLRVALPIIQNDTVLAIMHLEFDHVKIYQVLDQLEQCQNFINRCASNVEVILLRSEIDSIMLGMVQTMVATIEAKDTYTIGHSERVCRYSMAIANKLKLNKDLKKLLMISSLCHDIGKIGIPDAILKKTSLLTVEEYEEMKLHPTIGANIISNMPNAKRFLSGVKYHHEKWDGTGYPEGLVGENIPFFGRIVAVADVFDAMVSGRTYSGFMDESDAVEKIQSESELFDPEIIEALVKSWDDGEISLKTSTILQKVNKKL